MHRPTVIIGNWKMHKSISEAKVFIRELKEACRMSHSQVGLAVPFTMIQACAEEAKGTPLSIGAQNVHDAEEGAFTGEISCRMVKDAGAAFVLVGHSERRHLFHESDAWINRKLKRVLGSGLRAVFCVGETLEQHEKGAVEQVLRTQIQSGLQGITLEQLGHAVIAYEPVWAIGTGQTATPETAEKAHRICRQIVAETWGAEAAEKLVIQYGGSVKPENAAALLQKPDIDGLLVGGASLAVDSFMKIIQAQEAILKG